jgi:hypothetical protein
MSAACLPTGYQIQAINYYTAHISGRLDPFRPPFTLPAGAAPVVARVWKTEEKGSDVNLGVHLVRDGFKVSDR